MSKSPISGVTYFKLEKRYDGDVTKNCGLTGTEIDANFHFLRGREISSIGIDDGCLKIELLDGSHFIVPNFKDYIIDTSLEVIEETVPEPTLEGSSYDKESGVLTLSLNGVDFLIGGFTTKDEFGVYVTSGIKGDGTKCNPIRIPGVNDTGVLAPVDEFINGSVAENEVSREKRYLTKEKVSPQGYYYNYKGVQEIEEFLLSEKSRWRVPTFEEWSTMLNGLEYCAEEFKDHFNESVGFYGQDAGYAVKSDVWEDEPLGNNSLCIYPTSTEPYEAILWTNEERSQTGEILTKRIIASSGQVETTVIEEQDFYPVRLVKDIECNGDGADIVEIDGVPYDTIEMNHDLSGVTVRRLWLKTNLSLEVGENNFKSEGEPVYKYFVNEYDHISGKWFKKELKDNYSVVIKSYNGYTNEEVVNHGGTLEIVWNRTKEYVDSAITKEKNERIEADNTLAESIDREKQERVESDNILADAIETERQERVAEDSALTDAIETERQERTAEVSALTQAIESERQERTTTDSALTETIETERQERIESELELSNEIETVKDNLNEEVEKREREDESIWHAIDMISGASVVVELEQLSASTQEIERILSEEISNREDAISALTKELAEEARMRQETIEHEEEERKNSDELLENAIEEEKNSREQAVSSLTEDIEEEIHNRIEAISSLTVQINSILSEIYEDIDGINYNLSSETQFRIDADNELKELISTETKTREEEIAEIKEILSGETQGLVERINELDERLSAETETRKEGVNELKYSISAETEVREEQISELENRLSSETEERKHGISELEKSLSAETQERIEQIAELSNEINEELNSIKEAVSGISEELKTDILSLELSLSEINDDIKFLASALNDVIGDINSIDETISAITESIDEIWEELNKKDDGIATHDIVFSGRDEEVIIIPSGTSLTDALETVAKQAGGGEGKVKDILINDASIFDEKTGIAELKIVNMDSDISIEMSGNTISIGINGMSNGTIVLN